MHSSRPASFFTSKKENTRKHARGATTKTNYLFIIPALLALLIAGCTTTQTTQPLAFPPIITGTTEQGDVAIELTPLRIENNELIVDLSANTHSVDLSAYDLNKLITLTYDNNAVAPASAPTLQGHHNSGTLTFPLKKIPSTITITITGMPQQNTRTYTWNVQP